MSRCARVICLLTLLASALLHASSQSGTAAEPAGWQAGFAKVVITPDELMWMSGYGNRDRPAEGTLHDLYARAAALRDPGGKTVVFVATDLIGVPATMAEVVSRAVEQEHGIGRAELMLTCSHTHCGPALDDMLSHMLPMDEKDWEQVRRYQQTLNAKLIGVIGEAIADLQPAQLAAGQGACGFAVNRRAPIGIGPTDHTVPVLRVTGGDGRLRGVVFGYACHNTTLSFYQWCGDYAGFAALSLEERHPGAVALFHTGCGADQNPLPRRSVELAEKYGRTLAFAVEEVLGGKMTPVEGPLRTAFERVELTFDSIPSQEQLSQTLQSGNRFEQARTKVLLGQIEEQGRIAETYPYPVQVWQLGEAVTWIALGGEIVVDYSLRLKRELGGRTWVTGYANDVMAYIPSERVLQEGGYEGETSMVYYQMPSTWQAGLEDKIVETAVRLSRQVRSTETSGGGGERGAR